MKFREALWRTQMLCRRSAPFPQDLETLIAELLTGQVSLAWWPSCALICSKEGPEPDSGCLIFGKLLSQGATSSEQGDDGWDNTPEAPSRVCRHGKHSVSASQQQPPWPLATGQCSSLPSMASQHFAQACVLTCVVVLNVLVSFVRERPPRVPQPWFLSCFPGNWQVVDITHFCRTDESI